MINMRIADDNESDLLWLKLDFLLSWANHSHSSRIFLFFMWPRLHHGNPSWCYHSSIIISGWRTFWQTKKNTLCHWSKMLYHAVTHAPQKTEGSKYSKRLGCVHGMMSFPPLCISPFPAFPDVAKQKLQENLQSVIQFTWITSAPSCFLITPAHWHEYAGIPLHSNSFLFLSLSLSLSFFLSFSISFPCKQAKNLATCSERHSHPNTSHRLDLSQSATIRRRKLCCHETWSNTSQILLNMGKLWVFLIPVCCEWEKQKTTELW